MATTEEHAIPYLAPDPDEREKIALLAISYLQFAVHDMQFGSPASALGMMRRYLDVPGMLTVLLGRGPSDDQVGAFWLAASAAEASYHVCH